MQPRATRRLHSSTMRNVLLNVGRYVLRRFSTFRAVRIVYLVLCATCIFMLHSYYAYLHASLFVNKDIHSQCVLPNIDPFDPSITHFHSLQEGPLKCDPTPSLTFVDDSGYLRFNESVYNRFKYGDLTCVYSIVERVDDYHVKFKPEVSFQSPVDVRSDAFTVKCRNSAGKTVYENIHSKIDRKSVEKSRQFKNESDEDFSVFIFGIDSVSRLAAIRKLPKTFHYLTKTLGGYVFNGFTKVGESTSASLVGLLCGRLLHEFDWSNVKDDHSDKYPFIFYDFEKNGYVTMHTEDRPDIATFSYHGEVGFKNRPTVHYSRPYWQAMTKIKQTPFLVDQALLFLESKSLKLRKSSSLCYGNRPNHMLVVDYVKQYLQAYKGKRRFFLSWLNELAHDYINFLEYGDNDFMELIKWMHKEKHLERAVFFFYSDHGSRVQDIRNSYVGRIEDRMPFMSLVIPEALKKKYPQIVKNLEENQNKLTTPMDAYGVLRDILEKRYSFPNYSSSDNERDPNKPHSISLFKEIPKQRSCETAKIPDHFCACFSSKPVNISQPIFKTMAHFVVSKINDILLPVRSLCANLELDRILEGSTVVNNLQRNLDYKSSFTLWNLLLTPNQRDDTIYVINIRTVPGYATFEATVRLSSNGVMKVMDNISRTNRFGSQSKCIEDRVLQNYCFCS